MNKRLGTLIATFGLLATTVLSAAGLPPAPGPNPRGGKTPAPCGFNSHCTPRPTTQPGPCHFNPRSSGCNTLPRAPR
jgi:hypothetical protein